MKVHDKANPSRYLADENRYDTMKYRRCGKSGILLPLISLGLWHNFGFIDSAEKAGKISRKAFDLGITHFDLANNYGPPFGSAEETFGMILKKDLGVYRNELFISTKAGYDMWDGPYGNFGSRKYLITSLDDSLKRMGLEYVDLFYHHRPDADTPLEETMLALDHIVKSGKALYVGISNYDAERTADATRILAELRTPFIVHQARYSMLDRWVEKSLLDILEKEGKGMIAFSPLAQGMLTDKYLDGIPANSRAGRGMTYLEAKQVMQNLERVRALNNMALERKQKLSQMALSWILKDKRVSSVLVGVSSEEQLIENINCIDRINFSDEELKRIEQILK
ncbi:MAG TPA: L-glyceraldehyde 3-phosphate reductase [Bacteroidales bacterium]|nr:L-glyceraldehyde 3-phosphate reductase [Bacteroidales bacterium]